MTPPARRALIAGIVADAARTSVGELAARLGISRETARRDLAVLDREGTLRKVHGGAVPVVPRDAVVGATGATGGIGVEGSFERRAMQNAAAKRAVARAAATLLRSGDSVFVDTGSTTLAFAAELARIDGLTVITNSAAIAALAERGGGARVYLLGGEYRRGGRECVGDMTVQQIRSLRAAHAFLTVGSLDASGAADFDLQEAQVARAMVERADAVTVLVDASKFEARAVFPVVPLEALTRVVAERVPAPARRWLERAGVVAVVAP